MEIVPRKVWIEKDMPNEPGECIGEVEGSSSVVLDRQINCDCSS